MGFELNCDLWMYQGVEGFKITKGQKVIVVGVNKGKAQVATRDIVGVVNVNIADLEFAGTRIECHD